MARGTRSLDSEAAKRPVPRKVSGLRGLAPFLAPYRWMMVLALIALVLTSAVSLALPIAARRVIDGFNADNIRLLNDYFLIFMVISALLALGTGLRYYIVTRLGERVVADIRKAVFAKVIGHSPAFFEKNMSGEILSRITTDTTLILSVIGSSVSVALRNLLTFSGGLVLLFLTSAKLTGLVLLVVPLIIVPIIVMGRRLRRLSRENQDWIANSSGMAAEALTSIQTVQAFTHETQTGTAFANVTEESFASAKDRILTRAIMTMIVIFLVFAGVVGVLWIGARDVRAGVMSVGMLIQFVIYAVLVAGSVGSLSEIWGELLRAAGATERLVELLHADDNVTDPARPETLTQPVRGAITLENVSFQYPSRPGVSALDDVTLRVAPGETIALVGPSGAGKSTVLQLLLRFYDPQQGRVLLDGVAIDHLARADFRRHIALVPQDPVIFSQSARENIRFGRPDASDAEVQEAASAAAAHDFILKLPDGYDSTLGERGVMLSGGQRQRIAIARAILRNAPILLLDEATSALDAESESAVQKAVADMAKNRTVIVVAHRLATVKQADRIIVFDEGRIVAEGTHDSLVTDGGLYARLAKLQFTDGAT